MMSLSALYERYTLSRLKRFGAQARWASPLGVPLHMIEFPETRSSAGELPSLILVHGLGSSASSYGRLMAEAAPHFKHLIAPSAPAHGASPYHKRVKDPDALFELWLALLDELTQDEPALLLGNSLGGAISMRYALARPERVRGLILCSPAGPQMSAEDIAQLKATFSMERLGDGARFLRALLAHPPRLTPLIGLGVRSALSAPHIQAFLRDLSPEVGLSPSALSALTPPILLMWGQQERVLPRGVFETYLRALPPDQLDVLEPEGFGHSPQLEQPQEVLKLALAWCRRHPELSTP